MKIDVDILEMVEVNILIWFGSPKHMSIERLPKKVWVWASPYTLFALRVWLDINKTMRLHFKLIG